MAAEKVRTLMLSPDGEWWAEIGNGGPASIEQAIEEFQLDHTDEFLVVTVTKTVKYEIENKMLPREVK